MQVCHTPEIALGAFQTELSLRKKTPAQIINKLIQEGIITKPLADQLIQLAAYKVLIERYDVETASLAWRV